MPVGEPEPAERAGELERPPRVTRFEPIEGGSADERKYALRYRDQSLSLGERQVFEDLIEQDHGIKVASTEKRGARGRRARAA